jgi:hypothetical protein
MDTLILFYVLTITMGIGLFLWGYFGKESKASRS